MNLNIPIDSDKVNKIQKIITLLDTTIKMLNSLISLKNNIKKEIWGEKDKKEETNNTNSQQQNQNNNSQPQTSNIINERSFENYINNQTGKYNDIS